jgi:hypothetical protein
VSAGGPAGSLGEPPWSDLSEQLLSTVMQRLEILTDQALADQLAQRVRPAVERAGAELVERIGSEMRALVRACVAEAIEREISAMRDRRSPPASS